MERENLLKEFQNAIGYIFNDLSLLEKALVHRSYGNENWNYKSINNEKLELLGDAVLDLIVTEYLYRGFKDSSEGELAKLKSMIVSEPVLAKIALNINLGNYLLLSKGEEITGGRQRESIIGDAFEALLGGIYLDSNFDIVKKFALKYLKNEIEHINENEDLIDYKTILQEYSQRECKRVPEYIILDEIGPDHNKQFKIGVRIRSKILGEGIGRNKKTAEQMAAKTACKTLDVMCTNEAL